MERIREIIRREKNRIEKQLLKDTYNTTMERIKLYESKSVVERLEKQIEIVLDIMENERKNVKSKPLGYAEWDNDKEEQPQMFKELSIDELLKGLGAVLQPVPKKEIKSESELKREEFNEKLKESLMRDMLHRVNQNKKCVLLCDIVFEGNYYKTHRKVFDVLEVIGNTVIVDIGTYRGVPVPKECVNFL